MSSKVPLASNRVLTSIGVLPLRIGPVRFAIGAPDGITSNAWRIWTRPAGDVYISCRDNFQNAKVSLHTSGRWRMGFTSEAIGKNPELMGFCDDGNRAWEVWDRPPEILPKIVAAFRLIFPTSELGVRPEQRSASKWKDVIYIEAAPEGKVTTVTLFITRGDIDLRHESEPSFRLASLPLGNELHAQLVAHSEVEGNLPSLINNAVLAVRKEADLNGIEVPSEAYGYFFGREDTGVRFIFGAKIIR